MGIINNHLAIIDDPIGNELELLCMEVVKRTNERAHKHIHITSQSIMRALSLANIKTKEDLVSTKLYALSKLPKIGYARLNILLYMRNQIRKEKEGIKHDK